ncbi:hypothetical protein GDO81_020093 [Engystomops pustulosus]|uniref:Uncharacterized protein n=1 Tax=Engystomops pustulosus TaxID=76066 RepID=A0AAV6YSS4_ENGPU|nr:hypothetical protein GDO81_020093 [Engystomops pustulosus]
MCLWTTAQPCRIPEDAPFIPILFSQYRKSSGVSKLPSFLLINMYKREIDHFNPVPPSKLSNVLEVISPPLFMNRTQSPVHRKIPVCQINKIPV